MERLNAKRFIIILVHALVGWGLCGSVMGIGLSITSERNALIIHGILAPIFFIIISLFYFRTLNYTTPLQTAIIFVAFILFMDIFVVTILILRNLEMISSIWGTWVPIILIFLATYLTGLFARQKAEAH
jgi:hypothetical protein